MVTDLHTHILPGMDDGAANVAESLELLRELARQGVDTVALTPHFYPDRESSECFLNRREQAWQRLNAAVAQFPQEQLPRLVLGAEVAWVPGLWDWEALDRLCYAGTDFLLLELPISPWNEEMFRQIYKLISCTGIIPVIAHVDRYLFGQEKLQLQHLFQMQLPMQVSAEAVLRFFGRRKALSLLKDYGAMLISDCHNLRHRPPNMALAVNRLERRYGKGITEQILAHGEILG